MSIIRRHKTDKFSIISNHCLQRSDISWKAKGIYAYLMTLPDDWVLYITELINHATDGKDSTRTGFDELVYHGYVTKQRTRNEAGHMTGWDYDVYEFPEGHKPKAENPHSDNPPSEKPPLQKTKNKQRTDNTKDSIYTSEFLEFWKAYPRKIGKGGAFRSWKRIKDRPPLKDLILSVEEHAKSRDWLKDGGEYIPHPQTWLNQRRWEDEINDRPLPSSVAVSGSQNPEDYTL